MEPRHREAPRREPLPEHAEPHVSLVEWLELGDGELRERYDRLYFPRNDPRFLRRNALVALGNTGDREHRPRGRGLRRRTAIRSCASTRDWALTRLDEAPE